MCTYVYMDEEREFLFNYAFNIKMAYPVKYVHDLVPPLESQN